MADGSGKIMSNEKGWTKEWPTKAGWYWFWGYRFKSSAEPRLCMVRVHVTEGNITRLADGNFMYKAEGTYGVFHKATVPPPYDKALEMVRNRNL
jgi:hypothetical protein